MSEGLIDQALDRDLLATEIDHIIEDGHYETQAILTTRVVEAHAPTQKLGIRK